MRSSTRRLALILLPAALLAGGYFLMHGSDVRQRIRTAERDLEQLRAKAPTRSQLTTQSARLASATAEVGALETTIAARQPKEAADEKPIDARIVGRIGRILETRRLVLLKEVRGQDVSSQISDRLSSAWRSEADRLVMFEFRGRFLDVLSALEDIRGALAEVQPLDLTMRRVPEGGAWHTWVLTVALG